MSNTSKPLSAFDGQQTLKMSYNDKDASLAVSGFLAGAVGRKVDLEIVDEVETYTFTENGTTLYVIVLTYTDADRTTLESAERTA